MISEQSLRFAAKRLLRRIRFMYCMLNSKATSPLKCHLGTTKHIYGHYPLNYWSGSVDYFNLITAIIFRLFWFSIYFLKIVYHNLYLLGADPSNPRIIGPF